MSTIDRRAFVAGCLAVAMAGCTDPAGQAKLRPPSANRTCQSAPPNISFMTAGCWTQEGTTLMIYAVT
jgi:hypothetical protein